MIINAIGIVALFFGALIVGLCAVIIRGKRRYEKWASRYMREH